MEKTPESNLTLAHQHWIYPARLSLAMPTLPREERSRCASASMRAMLILCSCLADLLWSWFLFLFLLFVLVFLIIILFLIFGQVLLVLLLLFQKFVLVRFLGGIGERTPLLPSSFAHV